MTEESWWFDDIHAGPDSDMNTDQLVRMFEALQEFVKHDELNIINFALGAAHPKVMSVTGMIALLRYTVAIHQFYHLPRWSDFLRKVRVELRARGWTPDRISHVLYGLKETL